MTVHVSRRGFLRLGVIVGSSAALAGLAACGTTSQSSPAPAATTAPAAPAATTAPATAKPAAPAATTAPAAQTGAAVAKKASITLGMPELEVVYIAPILTIEAMREKGYDAKYKNFGSSAIVLQGVVAGDVQLAHNAMAAALTAVSAGVPITALLNDQRMAWVLAANASIQSPADLNDKVVAVGPVGTTTDVLSQTTFKKAGITPRLVRNNASEQSMQALILGQVEGACYSAQDQINANQKAPGKTKVLVNYTEDLGPEFIGYAIWGANDLVRANPDLQQDLITTVEAVHKRLYDDKEFALSQIKRIMPDTSPAVASETYDFIKKSEIWPRNANLSTKGLQNTVSWLSGNGMLKQQLPIEQWAKPTAA